jgi:hypothetical protein
VASSDQAFGRDIEKGAGSADAFNLASYLPSVEPPDKYGDLSKVKVSAKHVTCFEWSPLDLQSAEKPPKWLETAWSLLEGFVSGRWLVRAFGDTAFVQSPLSKPAEQSSKQTKNSQRRAKKAKEDDFQELATGVLKFAALKMGSEGTPAFLVIDGRSQLLHCRWKNIGDGRAYGKTDLLLVFGGQLVFLLELKLNFGTASHLAQMLGGAFALTAGVSNQLSTPKVETWEMPKPDERVCPLSCVLSPHFIFRAQFNREAVFVTANPETSNKQGDNPDTPCGKGGLNLKADPDTVPQLAIGTSATQANSNKDTPGDCRASPVWFMDTKEVLVAEGLWDCLSRLQASQATMSKQSSSDSSPPGGDIGNTGGNGKNDHDDHGGGLFMMNSAHGNASHAFSPTKKKDTNGPTAAVAPVASAALNMARLRKMDCETSSQRFRREYLSHPRMPLSDITTCI